MAQCTLEHLVPPDDVAAHIHAGTDELVILIGSPRSSLPRRTWWEVVHASGGSPNLKAKRIIVAYGSKASSSLIRVFQIP